MDQRGFTLIEVTVVAAIAVVLVTVAIPNYSLWSANQNLKKNLSELKGDLQLARMISLKTGAPVVVRFNSPENNRYLVFLDNGIGTPDSWGNGQRDADELLIGLDGRQRDNTRNDTATSTLMQFSRSLERGITFSTTRVPVPYIAFSGGTRSSPTGIAPAVLSLSNSHNKTQTLRVLAIGEVL